MTVLMATGRHCGGTRRRAGGGCTRPAGWGTPHPGFGRCKLHGGSAPSGLKAAALEETRYLLAHFTGLAVDIDDPLQELRRLAGMVVAWVEVCRGEVNDLDHRAAFGDHGEHLHSAIPLFERAMERACDVLLRLVQLELGGQVDAISKAKAQMLLRAVDAGLAEAGIPHPQREEARRATGRHLRVIAAAAERANGDR